MVRLACSSEKRIRSLHQELTAENLTNEQALASIYALFTLNEEEQLISVQALQQLWIKCMKKYKFKLHEWQHVQAERNIHCFLLQGAGEGYLTVLKLYQDRNLTAWYDDAFEVAVQTLVTKKGAQILQLFLLSTMICHEAYHHFLTRSDVQRYFEHNDSYKIRQLYIAYIYYSEQRTVDTSTHLYKMLAKYNPHYNVQAKRTPLFFKQLAEQSGTLSR